MRRLIALLMAVAVASPAAAQTALTAPSINWAGQWTTTSPQSIIGYDSGTGSPCIVGSTATCAIQSSSSGTSASAIYSAQVTCTTGAVALSSRALVNGVIIKALTTNTGTAYVGPSTVTTANGYPLKAGEAISYAVLNMSAIYLVCSNTTDVVAITGN